MRKPIILILYVTLLALLIPDVALAQVGPWGDPAKGARLFGNKGCAQCHAIGGEGAKVGPDLLRKQFSGTLLQLAGTLWNHWPTMAEKMEQKRVTWPQFTQNEMADIISYIYYLRYLDVEGDVAQGKRLMAEKGCLKCHSLAEKGGKLGPSLDKMKRYASPLFVAQAMWNHGEEMDAKMKELGIARPQFSGREMVHLLAYIRAAAKPAKGDKEFMPPGDPAKGQRVFTQKGCINCHSIDSKGKTVGPDLSQIEFLGSATELAGVMWNHGPEMWAKMKEKNRPRPIFEGREMADLIAYLYFLKFSDKPGVPANGEKLFVAKGCAGCHAVTARGPAVGPDISKIRGQISSIQMAQLMWNHAPKMATVMQKGKVPWPEFKGKEMPDLLAYLTAIREKK